MSEITKKESNRQVSLADEPINVYSNEEYDNLVHFNQQEGPPESWYEEDEPAYLQSEQEFTEEDVRESEKAFRATQEWALMRDAAAEVPRPRKHGDVMPVESAKKVIDASGGRQDARAPKTPVVANIVFNIMKLRQTDAIIKRIEVGLRVVADDKMLPDKQAEYEVECLLDAAEMRGAFGKGATEARKAWLDQYHAWRQEGGIKSHCGDFPFTHLYVDGLYDTREDAEKAIIDAGGAVMPPGMGCNSSDELMAIIRSMGAKIYWSELDTALKLQHADIDEWKEPVKAAPPEFGAITQLQKGIIRCVMTTKKELVERKNPEDPDNPITKIVYRPVQILKSESGGKAMASKLLAQLGTAIDRIDESSVEFDRIIALRDNMSKAERDQCVDLVKSWMLRIPYIGVVDAANNIELAQLASMLPYVTFAERRMQFHPDYRRGPYQQRFVPIYGGDPGSGKSTIAKNLLPRDGVYKGRIVTNFVWTGGRDGMNDMKRAASGAMLLINDELGGIKTTDAAIVNAFITLDEDTYHEKYRNYENMVRSDVLVGTTNQSNEVPANRALHERLQFLHLETTGVLTGNPLRKALIKWMEDHRDQLMVGGLILAEQEVDLNPSKAVRDQKARAVVAMDNSNQDYAGIIKSMMERGIYSCDTRRGKFISIRRICLEAALLKYPKRVVWDDTGLDDVGHKTPQDVISPSDLSHKSLKGTSEWESGEFHEVVEQAYKRRSSSRSETGAIKQIKTALDILHGDGAVKKYEAPTIKGVRGRVLEGTYIDEGRLSDYWLAPNAEYDDVGF